MNNRSGFTLIEMILVIILLGIVSAVIAIPLMQGARGWFDAATREGISQSGRMAIERMTREIRNTARTAANAPCISAASAVSITFSDLDGDITNCNTTTFSLSGSNLMRGVDTLANNISALTIKYYKKDNSWINEDPVSAVNRPLICRLSIEITSKKGVETIQKYSEVYLANMRVPGVCIP